MLDESHLLLRFASEEVVALKVDPNSQNSFFAIVDISGSEVKILGVYENVSEEFLRLYENCADEFRLPLGTNDGPSAAQPCCSVASSLYARQNHERFKVKSRVFFQVVGETNPLIVIFNSTAHYL